MEAPLLPTKPFEMRIGLTPSRTREMAAYVAAAPPPTTTTSAFSCLMESGRPASMSERPPRSDKTEDRTAKWSEPLTSDFAERANERVTESLVVDVVRKPREPSVAGLP